ALASAAGAVVRVPLPGGVRDRGDGQPLHRGRAAGSAHGGGLGVRRALAGARASGGVALLAGAGRRERITRATRHAPPPRSPSAPGKALAATRCALRAPRRSRSGARGAAPRAGAQPADRVAPDAERDLADGPGAEPGGGGARVGEAV